MPTVVVHVPEELRFLLPPARRGETLLTRAVATDTLGHVVQTAGIPLTEVGRLVLDGRPVPAAARVADGDLVLIPVARPQPTPTRHPRFLLDVHLGGLARRLRLLGLDAAYRPDADDPDLVRQAGTEHRILLSRDRGLLRRRTVLLGAFVRGADTATQLDDVLDRFAPPLAPWTRCTRCGARLRPAVADQVAPRLEPGTRRTYADFACCEACGQIYWRGAHAARLERLVAHAEAVVRRRTAA